MIAKNMLKYAEALAQPSPTEQVERAGLVEEAEYFSYHSEMGAAFFKTEREARDCCAENLKQERDDA